MIKPDYFIIKEVLVDQANALVEFEHKLSGNATHLIGYKVTANKTNLKAIATVGISFNGARENTINTDLIMSSSASQGRRSLLLSQKMLLIPNSYIKGYVEDLGLEAPYRVKIYFHLARKN